MAGGGVVADTWESRIVKITNFSKINTLLSQGYDMEYIAIHNHN